MSGKTVRAFTVSILLMATPASAEMSTESVTVTGSRDAYHDFSQTFATATPVTGKMARWEHRICPMVVGQNARYAAFITQHIKYVALAARAPVNTEETCSPNIEIVFTTTPQALFDTVNEKTSDYLGYFTSSAQQKQLATVTRPIQAWYATETMDIKGRSHPDTGRTLNIGNTITNLGQSLTDLPPFYASNGNHLNDGIHTGFRHILIVVDSTKLGGQDIVPLADYISMLALSQINSLDACQGLPSIVNRMAAGCRREPENSLTMYDLAYLQGLYHMTTGRTMVAQRSEIGDLMTDTLEKQK